MGQLKQKLDDALGIDVEKVLNDADNELAKLDSKEIEKYNNQKKIIDELQTNLKTARTMVDKDWAESLLKLSAEKSMEVQERFRQEIEDNPVSKNVTSFSELSNSIVNTVNAVLDIKREEEKIGISKEKNELRRREIDEGGMAGKTINAQGKVVGVGTNNDILRLVRQGIIDIDTKQLENGDTDAITET